MKKLYQAGKKMVQTQKKEPLHSKSRQSRPERKPECTRKRGRIKHNS